MTERLSTLLHDEAHDLAIPPAPTSAVLTAGRRRVRRRRAAVASVAAAAVIGGGALVHVADSGPRTPVVLDPATAPAATDWAVAQGSTVHLGTGATVTVPGQVKSLYYTSAGTLLRFGASPYTDGPHTSGSTYWLAHPDGTRTDLHLSLNDRVPGTDPTLPYLAYAVKGDDARHWTVVIRDVRTGDVVRQIPIEGAFTWGGWAAPPVSLSGDHVYVGVDGTLLDVLWRIGRVARTSVPSHMPETRGGREVVGYDKEGRFEIIDLVTDEVITTLTFDPSVGYDRYPHLSPDGTHLLMLPSADCTEAGSCTYDGEPVRVINLTTGASRATSLEYGAFGWTATDRLLVVDGTSVKSCDPDTMDCTSTPVTLDGTGPIRVSGNDNES